MTPFPPAPEPPEPGEPLPTPAPEPPAPPETPEPIVTPEPTETAAPTPTPNGTAPNGTGEVLPGFEINGWDLLVQAMAGFVDSLAAGTAALVDQLEVNFLTLPAAGEPANPATWQPPSDPFFQATFTVYWTLAVLALVLVWAIGWFNVAVPRGASRRQRLKTLSVALIGILAGWTLLMAWYHLWNVAALNIAPEGSEFVQTPGSSLKLGIGIVLGLVLLAVKAIVVIIGIVVQMAFVVLTYTFIAFWPFAVGLYATGLFPLAPMGRAWITAAAILPLIQFVKAGVLRLIFEFPLNLDAPETGATFLLTIVGILVAFVVIPWYSLKYLVPQTIVSAGGQVQTGAEDRMNKYRDRAPSSEDLKATMAGRGREMKSRLGDRDIGSALRSWSGRVSSSGWGSSSSGDSRSVSDTRARTRGSGATYRSESDYKTKGDS